jgi:hypothetical protein
VQEAVSRPNAACPGSIFSTFAPYIEGAGSPAMEINCCRNKPLAGLFAGIFITGSNAC